MVESTSLGHPPPRWPEPYARAAVDPKGGLDDRSPLRDLIARGLPDDHALLFVIDGGTGIRKAIDKTYERLAVVQRCQEHKRRNVLDHLPPERHGNAKRVLQQAYESKDWKRAQKQLQALARKL